MSIMASMRKDGFRGMDMNFYDELLAHNLASAEILRALLARDICCVTSFLTNGELVLDEIMKQVTLIKDEEEHTHTLYMREKHLLAYAHIKKLIGIIPELTMKYSDAIRWVEMPQQHHRGGLRGDNTYLEGLLVELTKE